MSSDCGYMGRLVIVHEYNLITLRSIYQYCVDHILGTLAGTGCYLHSGVLIMFFESLDKNYLIVKSIIWYAMKFVNFSCMYAPVIE